MAQAEDIFLRTKHRTFRGLTEDIEHEWTGPFYFIQAADPQLGLMKAQREGDCDGGGDEWTEEVDLTKQAVAAMNQLRPRPRFMVLCGDLVHAMPGTIFRDDQERDLKMALSGTDPSIPLVFVSGNHDLGNTPTPKTVAQYCSAWGDDYFSFWVGGVLFLVLNSQLFYDASACPQLKESQETWLEEQLSKISFSSSTAPKHIIVFQHIPLYIKNHDEEDDYFNLQREVRQKLIDRFKKAGVKAVFSGHYHRNAGGCNDGLDMVVSSAIGCQLGEDTHGVRVVVVTADQVIHRYHTLDQMKKEGMDEDLRKLLQA
ncbi:serine/threonine-protein phosphatase CPPED1 isoform X2 [Nerophis lumbriciformis]|uniref:serine/threonine-protein phosphatase CPPED1 isoform X2 n=1 Tax=Nerophis lumbriciformis TaxID=546530 RepID=UPI002ADF20B6|nr:serine/threonine-protein phosphatase CPPED1-like isoform X2 [Nerophis lumbriciformis]XP_061823279.1 serine/threonine-protein phosphatase CPPED1-like isoform X2 [Nerophis lumbriciformis]XP_061823280.1 serine/threonine-protein phosphatase CPPED1-like isoform X2 [Nerophis lumbriciformis]